MLSNLKLIKQTKNMIHTVIPTEYNTVLWEPEASGGARVLQKHTSLL